MTERRGARHRRQAALLERLYERLNHPQMVAPDPLEQVLKFPEHADREIVALISAVLSYGNIATIKASAESVLERMGASPRRYVLDRDAEAIRRDFKGFRHRVTRGEELAALLLGAREAIQESGSLGAAFQEGIAAGEDTLLPALERFVMRLRAFHGPAPWHLLSAPSSGSACKRLNMLLRWMVRRDAVDPGGWAVGMESKLVMPLDTHMFRLARAMGLTTRKTADLRAALEVTERFRFLRPEDPVRYDFALTRLGIRGDLRPEQFISEWRAC